jgi:hypothetical protein
MTAAVDYLTDPARSEISYDGHGRVACFRGAGRPWDVFLVAKSGARRPDRGGTCSFDDILEHWFDRDELERLKLQTIVEDRCPAGGYERLRLAELLARIAK